MPPTPASVTTAASQSKPSRPRETLDPPRQVHFASEGAKVPITTSGTPKVQNQAPQFSDQPKPASAGNLDPQKAPQQKQGEQEPTEPGKQEITQPDSFPGVGHFPGAVQPHLLWHRSSAPGQSLCSGFPPPGSHLPGSHNTFGGPQGLPQPQGPSGFSLFAPHGPASSIPHPTTYIGRPPPNMAADYQNTGPPPRGQCYQPPVPDTTFGPMYHVYTPRFDPPGLVPTAPVGHQTVQYIPVQSLVMRMEPQALFTPNYAYYPPVAPVPMGQYFVPQQQMYAGQPMLAHPPMVYAHNPHLAQQFQPVPSAQPGGIMGPPGGGPPTVIPIMAGNPGPNLSEVAGVGRTPMEEAVRQHHFAHQNKLFEPQDFKPADDDPSRFYYVREVDGNWTQRNRFTIDNTGDCRWFVTPEGWFYAVRQPD